MITSLLQITEARSFSLFWASYNYMKCLIKRAAKHWWPSRSTRLNTNSRSFQLLLFVPAYQEGFNSHITEWFPWSFGWWVGREAAGKAWPSGFSYPHASLPSEIQEVESQGPVFSPHSMFLDSPLCYLREFLHCQDSEMTLFLLYRLSNWISPHYIRTPAQLICVPTLLVRSGGGGETTDLPSQSVPSAPTQDMVQKISSHFSEKEY